MRILLIYKELILNFKPISASDIADNSNSRMVIAENADMPKVIVKSIDVPTIIPEQFDVRLTIAESISSPLCF